MSLPEDSAGAPVVADYRIPGLSLRAHPMALLRPRRRLAEALTCAAATEARDGARVKLAGLVTVRQRPGSAKGTMFITIEDETGIANLVIWPSLVEPFRREIIGARLLGVAGQVQKSPEGVTHIVAGRLVDLTDLVAALDAPAAHGDELPRARRHARPPRHPRSERVIPKSRDFR